jgi:hypothetical protein
MAGQSQRPPELIEKAQEQALNLVEKWSTVDLSYLANICICASCRSEVAALAPLVSHSIPQYPFYDEG